LIQILEILGLVLLSATKFLFAPSTTIAAGHGFLKTIIITFSGAGMSAVVFYFSGAWIFNQFAKLFGSKETPKKFNKKNRFIVSIKSKFGLIGYSFLMPFLSIPLGALLAAKYYRDSTKTISWLLTSIFVWTLILTTFSFYIKGFLN
jgi:hypothetical protein